MIRLRKLLHDMAADVILADMEHVDVLIVGAGLSGIGAACHLQREAPGVTYDIVEARAASGGTWDLFSFPGIRSDSDMYTLGYTFRPWKQPNAIADGKEILRYLRETAAAYGVDRHITYHCRVVRADWSAADARWTVTVEQAGTGERAAHLRLPLPVLGLLPVRPGLPSAMAWPAGFHRHDGASAALAGGPGRGRPAGRRHRQWCDGCHHRPGSRRGWRPGDHAAALAALGYTNASWTLKVDLVSAYLARMLRFMDQNGYAVVTPRLPPGRMGTSPFIEMTSGYFERSRASLPLQGDRSPWRLRQHYFKDAALFRGPVDEKELEFRPAPALVPPAG